MCGRFTLRAPASVVAEQFALLDVGEFDPRYNVAPTQPVAVVRHAGVEAASPRQLVWLRWGLVPGWAQDPAIGNRLINARAETAATKPAFRSALRRRRCLVVADGFYEWQRTGPRKQPYFIHMRDDRPFGFAGLWESWEGAVHSALETCAILTIDPNDLMRPIHDRMPVIIPPDDYGRWLDPAIERPEEIAPLLKPFGGDGLVAYPVGLHVNSPARDDPRCIEPV